ncbi:MULTISPECIES: LysM peptidoglycan-binding domain-containing protein [unclassified Bradyrhizobium]|uniref:LysM peptidoglycan-binding domain-containing protein n=1 Tax=unclassified Bradyrhizobium TaxID=2631580 RepID=UPI001CD34D7D|nr:MULTISPECIES: LysM peptidoglycan-binding domain-containing protein [unclassified Bradyrhizobium]MCA1378207.1 LysM peptidoglycan-binding domain-containing protein [Bradyrhizobium sp. IC4060]MCA1488096.1 LysM peptidoglycan-binding domain-containing protein [Bradyrhizobium sp. IC4061]MCA1515424.1 LysM peptidoglycan-binding domain-containing protein [Bradyrhizobium sp. NBAIM01]MCA1543966.1 LysM peptidoglycan-binding domain-containing protein [Bradyrhizobium sp. NBAIM32]
MITASKAFIAFCLLALVGTALVIGPTELRRLLPDGTKVTVAAKPEAKVEPQVGAKVEPKLEAKVEPKVEFKPESKPESKPELKPEQPKLVDSAPPAPEPKAGALAETQKQVAALGDLVPVKPPAPAADAGPRFDVARIDDHGEAAVIAGRATPGARVELLRDGKPLDSVVADASGQFVMTPPQLPAGSYDLTLRARAPDGTVTESGRTMPVTIAAAAPPPVRMPPVAKQEAKPAEKPDDKSDVVAALPSASPRLASVPDRQAARPKLIGAPKPKAFAQAPRATVVASASPAEALTAAPAEAGGSRIIARGDSLWALSRLAYGDGSRYAVIFNANRDKIQNPNLIYPGQTFVMPQKAE